MGFFALVLALLIEQARPLRPGNRVHAAFAGFAATVRRSLDGGERRQGAIGWAIVVAASLAVVALAERIAGAIHPLVLFALHVFVLYCTVGFRQFSQAFTEIRVALAADDAEGARRVLSGWLRGEDPAEEAAAESGASVGQTCRQSIAHALLAAHRHVLGPLFCYVVLPGALGPVLYRVAEMLARHWQRPAEGSDAAATADASKWPAFAARAFAVVDWVPTRLTAAGFAIVGNFEDAVYCWRGATAAVGPWDSRSVLMAVGSGAIGVRLADPALEARWAAAPRAFECPGAEAQPGSLPAAAGIVWRSLLLWLGLFALITVSAWMGR